MMIQALKDQKKKLNSTSSSSQEFLQELDSDLQLTNFPSLKYAAKDAFQPFTKLLAKERADAQKLHAGPSSSSVPLLQTSSTVDHVVQQMIQIAEELRTELCKSMKDVSSEISLKNSQIADSKKGEEETKEGLSRIRKSFDPMEKVLKLSEEQRDAAELQVEQLKEKLAATEEEVRKAKEESAAVILASEAEGRLLA